MNVAIERRVAPASRLAQKLAWPLRLSGTQAWELVIIGGCALGLADVMTGPKIWFGPTYMIIIAIAAWSLGWRQAVAVGMAILTMTLGANGFELYPHSGIASAWNIAMRVFAILVLIGMFHTARQMYAREWHLSRTDPLTGALNRKAFFELAGSRAHSRHWSVLAYADLDGFKTLNDTLGHAAGDECLRLFVCEVAKVIRKDDVLARLGGDEFAIYLDVKDETAARIVASRLHSAMNAIEFSGGETVLCSVGALILAPGSRSIDRELRAADVLMYQAKDRGSSLVVGTIAEVEDIAPTRAQWELVPEAQPSQPIGNARRSGAQHVGTTAARRVLRQTA